MTWNISRGGYILKDRPFIHINCASTADGKIAAPDGSPLDISTMWDRRRVHRLRASMGAILVGAGTVATDDPKLTVNPSYAGFSREIYKIVLDGRGRIDPASRFLRTEGRSIVVTTEAADAGWLGAFKRLEASLDMKLLVLDGGPDIDIDLCWSLLREEGISGVLVEGGSHTIFNILRSGSFDVFSVFMAPIVMGGRGPTITGGVGFEDAPLRLHLRSVVQPPDGGILLEYVSSGP